MNFLNEESRFVADTHALLWHFMDDSHLSTEARRRLQLADRGEAIIYVSVMTSFEVQYLFERGKISRRLWENFFDLIRDDTRESYQLVSIEDTIVRAFQKIPIEAIPELPDRVITATSLHLGVPLITKDQRMHRWEGAVTIW
ncbi:MAG: PIN domain-containing protein [Deltaproteobacteria bacterium]|nr:PIN domain-containing protein [Deltaproteobacteria bacterium]